MKQYKILNDYIKNGILDIETIVKEYSGYVYTIINNMTNNNMNIEDIEEIMSDVFFILWKNQDKLKAQDKVNFYIAGITKNLIREKYRKLNNNLNIDDYENTFFTINNISEIYEKNEQFRIMERRLNLLNKTDRYIFKLFYYKNIKAKEIAKELNMNEITVRSRLHRIKKQIKKDLKLGGYSYEE